MLEATEGRSAPYGLLFALVVGLVAAGPVLFDGEAILESFSDVLSPLGLLLVPVLLLLLIRVLSSDRCASFSDILAAEPDSIHRVGGSPVGVALLLLLLIVLLYSRVSLFGSGDDDSGN